MLPPWLSDLKSSLPASCMRWYAYRGTRNMHVHLCLAPVRRLCARVIYAGAGEARVACVTFAVDRS